MPTADVKCPRCRKQVPSGAAYCRRCGLALREHRAVAPFAPAGAAAGGRGPARVWPRAVLFLAVAAGASSLVRHGLGDRRVPRPPAPPPAPRTVEVPVYIERPAVTWPQQPAAPTGPAWPSVTRQGVHDATHSPFTPGTAADAFWRSRHSVREVRPALRVPEPPAVPNPYGPYHRPGNPYGPNPPQNPYGPTVPGQGPRQPGGGPD